MYIIPSAGAIVKPHPIMNNPMGLVNTDSTIWKIIVDMRD